VKKVTNEYEPDIADKIHKFHEEIAIPAESFAQAVAFATSQRSFYSYVPSRVLFFTRSRN
jgi:hypothetical protein